MAVKYIRMQWLNLHNDNLNDADDSMNVQEFNILCRLHHPRCVSFYGISHDAENILLVQVFVFFLFFNWLAQACCSQIVMLCNPPHHPASSSLSLTLSPSPRPGILHRGGPACCHDQPPTDGESKGRGVHAPHCRCDRLSSSAEGSAPGHQGRELPLGK